MQTIKLPECGPRRPEYRARDYMRHTEARRSDRSSIWRETGEQRTLHSSSIKVAAGAFVQKRKNRRVFYCLPTGSRNLKSEFIRLSEEWRHDTGKLSMLHKIVLHPAYQQIIGMGEKALPYIFKELNTRGGHWIWALSAITGNYDVVKPECTFREARQAWLQWGKDRKFL